VQRRHARSAPRQPPGRPIAVDEEGRAAGHLLSASPLVPGKVLAERLRPALVERPWPGDLHRDGPASAASKVGGAALQEAADPLGGVVAGQDGRQQRRQVLCGRLLGGGAGRPRVGEGALHA
jgi:hypothetical protein